MPSSDIHWLHSCGSTNKNPNLDLGGTNSEFQIAEVPLNNLFDNVSPTEAANGFIDYRCFYICNKHTKDFLTNINLTINSQAAGGANITIATKEIDDVQEVTLIGSYPDPTGFVIFDTEFGPPFTISFTGYVAFGIDLQTRLRESPYCNTVIVTGTNPYEVNFTGNVGKRNVQLMRVVQNDLLDKDWSRYNTVVYSTGDPWNYFGDSQIKVTRTIDPDYVPANGFVRVYNLLNGTYPRLSYTSFSGQVFTLAAPIPVSIELVGLKYPSTIVLDPPVPLPTPEGVLEVEGLINKKVNIRIDKLVEGSPIRTSAEFIDIDINTPSNVTFASVISLGFLRPEECFYVWVKRDTPMGSTAKLKDDFELGLTTTAKSFPG